MKTTKGFLVAFVILSSFPALARQTNASAQQGEAISTNNQSVNQSVSADASAQREDNSAQAEGSGQTVGSVDFAAMRPVNGELMGKLDSKSARVGDPVVVRTTEEVRTSAGIVIPRGSRIVGHVTDVQAHASGQQDSHVAIQFDRAELKDGRSLPIRSVIEQVSPSQAALAAAARGNTDESMYGGAGMPASSTGAGGAGRAGWGPGGALGGAAGAAGGAAASTANTVGAAEANAGSAAGATTNTMGAEGNAPTGMAANLGATATGVSGAASGAGSMALHTTAIPGVMLSRDATGATSGTLSASKRNVHLDGGTQMMLGVAALTAQ